MSGFENTNWTKPEYSREYRDHAENYLPERKLLLHMVGSFYRSFIADGRKKRILDLGCGNGILADALFRQDRNVEIVVTDGSAEMLSAARQRLAGLPVVDFCQITFEKILAGKFRHASFDFIVSSFAIHHLEMPQKSRLFQSIAGLLTPGGYFLNIDATTADPYTDWYFQLWKEWILAREESTKPDVSFADVPAQARVKPENHYDLLQDQLNALKNAGFVDVECHYRYGLFAIYGGRKAGGVK